ncbi:hypothetical protein HJC23_000153 [Cyclotella cryptica]|uniref:Uncharacterized protein n=1 Tax=Cyclotella cryptica TaxID=29204 RepID=A0ABD3PKR2_9STRA
MEEEEAEKEEEDDKLYDEEEEEEEEGNFNAMGNLQIQYKDRTNIDAGAAETLGRQTGARMLKRRKSEGTHNRENSENTKHKGHFSVFENYGGFYGGENASTIMVYEQHEGMDHTRYEGKMGVTENKGNVGHMGTDTFLVKEIMGFYGGENAAKSMVYEQHEGTDRTRCEGNMGVTENNGNVGHMGTDTFLVKEIMGDWQWEMVREEASRLVRLHEDGLKGNFKHRQKRSEVAWPDIPTDFDEWAPPKKRRRSRG